MSASNKPTQPAAEYCTAVAAAAGGEQACQEPSHLIDGIPYCETCNRLRYTIPKVGSRGVLPFDVT
jgi:hypothetical protein